MLKISKKQAEALTYFAKYVNVHPAIVVLQIEGDYWVKPSLEEIIKMIPQKVIELAPIFVGGKAYLTSKEKSSSGLVIEQPEKFYEGEQLFFEGFETSETFLFKTVDEYRMLLTRDNIRIEEDNDFELPGEINGAINV
jgi:hypothetical protein